MKPSSIELVYLLARPLDRPLARLLVPEIKRKMFMSMNWILRFHSTHCMVVPASAIVVVAIDIAILDTICRFGIDI